MTGIELLKVFGASGGAVGVASAIAIGLGLVPSSGDLARVESQASKVSGIETTVAVQAKQIETIEKTVSRIEARQSEQFDKIMDTLNVIDRRSKR